MPNQSNQQQNNEVEIDWAKYIPDEHQAPKQLLSTIQQEQSVEAPLEIDWSKYETSDESSPLPEGVRNTIAGIQTGATSQSFTASLGTYLESKYPIGRLFSTNKEGDWELWQSTPDWLGISEEEWDNTPEEQRRVMISKKAKKDIVEYWDADPDSTNFILSEVGGMFLDPSTAIPILGESKLARTASTAAVGAADIAAYETAQKGSPTLSGVATGAVVGGVAGRFLGGKGPMTAQADETIDLFNKVYPVNLKNTDDAVLAYKKTLEELGINDDVLKQAVELAGKKPTIPTTKAQADKLIKQGVKEAPTDTLFGKGFDTVFQPISDAVRRISPRLHMKFQSQQRKSLELAHDTMLKVDPFLRKVERLKWTDKTAYRTLHKAMFEGKGDVQQLSLKYLGDKSLADLRMYRSAMDNLYKLSKKQNPKLKYRKDYFPRWVKDYDYLKKNVLKGEDKTRIEQILAKEAEKLKRGDKGLTEAEIGNIYNKYIQGFYDSPKVKATPGGVKQRTVRTISDEAIEKAYAAPAASAHSYIKQMATDIYRKEMFGNKINTKFGDNLTDAIGAMANKYAKTQGDLDELKTLMNLLYVEGTRAPMKITTAFKDLGYASMLGNPLSALVQIGDIFISAAKIGGMNTMDGLAKALTGKGLSPKEFGLMDNIIEELVSTGPTKQILEKALSLGQFKRIDAIGKATLMNGALTKFRKQAKTVKGIQQLRQKWLPAFGDDWPEIESALRKGDITPNIKSMVFAELADIQPITLFEMPKWYLKHPDGRVLYMLKTFTMKYLNLLRRDMVDKFVQGDRMGAIQNGTALISALFVGGMTADTLKDGLLQRNTDFDAQVADNILKTSGLLNRYGAEKIVGSAKPVSETLYSFAPPVGWMDPIGRTMFEFAQTGEVRRETREDMVKMIPVIGKLWHNYAFGGLEEYNRRQ